MVVLDKTTYLPFLLLFTLVTLLFSMLAVTTTDNT